MCVTAAATAVVHGDGGSPRAKSENRWGSSLHFVGLKLHAHTPLLLLLPSEREGKRGRRETPGEDARGVQYFPRFSREGERSVARERERGRVLSSARGICRERRGFNCVLVFEGCRCNGGEWRWYEGKRVKRDGNI